jgi:TetR/AcrR family transcriptional regulator
VTATAPTTPVWAEHAADRSPQVQRSRARSIEQARVVVEAASRLADEQGSAFTIRELTRDAGVALRTFYRHFDSKDQLLLAVLEEMILEGCHELAELGAALPDPISRLRLFIEGAAVWQTSGNPIRQRFVTSEHVRLHQLVPDDLARITSAFTELLVPEIEAAQRAGLLAPGDAQRNAWFVCQLVMAVFHHHAFVDTPEHLGDELWAFCFRALGGAGQP